MKKICRPGLHSLSFPIVLPSVSVFPPISNFSFRASFTSFNQIFFIPLTTKRVYNLQPLFLSTHVCICVRATWGLGAVQGVGWPECVYSCFIGSEVHYSPNPQRSTHIWFCLWQEHPDMCTSIHRHKTAHIFTHKHAFMCAYPPHIHTHAHTHTNVHRKAAGFFSHWNQMAGQTQKLQAGWNLVLSKQ